MDEQKWKNFLLKRELQYRADHAEQDIHLDWLEPHCGSVEDIQHFLREIRLRIKEVKTIDEAEWATATSGIIVLCQ